VSQPVIICVDDQKTILDCLQVELIETLGDEYIIETADSGEYALALFQELINENYDIPLIISDCMMPNMPGDELLKHVHNISPETFKILLTAGTSRADVVVNAVNHANLYRYMLKPWDKGDLALTVYEAVKSYFKNQLLEEQNHALKDMNLELQERTLTLSQTIQDLKDTQQELIHSEKMATLGQVMAGVAHEINTPLGAIRSSVENIATFLNQHLEKIPTFFRLLSEESQQDFFALLKKSSRQKTVLSSKEKRKYRRALIPQLNEQAISNATTIADTLVEMGIYQDIEAFLPLLKTPKSQEILNTAYQLSSLNQSTQNIITASKNAAKVVSALKNFVHYDHTGKKIEADLIKGIETVLTLYQNQFKQGVKVIKNYAELPPIWCYPGELNQVWTNFVQNALQAMNYKGTLKIDVSIQYNHAIVSITDSGMGIPDDIKLKIFDAFYTTKSAGEGSGLGLDIVKKIVDKHDGKVTVSSIVGETTFTVSIPNYEK